MRCPAAQLVYLGVVEWFTGRGLVVDQKVVFLKNAITDEVKMPVTLPQWLQDLRRDEITERVGNDPRSVGRKVLGVDKDAVMDEVIGWGQADFDEPWGTLSSDDRVLLYAYFLQLRHLEELAEAFRMLFAGTHPNDPIIVDLGCGPFTGGLAIASALGADTRFDYVGVDRSCAMRRFGEQLASAAARLDAMPHNVRHWSPSLASVSWNEAPGWRDVIVIVSYLFASPTLDVAALIAELEGLLSRLGGGRVTVLYTNSARQGVNLSFPVFCDTLQNAGFQLYADDTGNIEIKRRTGARTHRLRYALFHRDRQSILRLGAQ